MLHDKRLQDLRQLAEQKFVVNMARVDDLVLLFNTFAPDQPPPGVTNPRRTREDLFRVVVVFFHSTFEEYIRTYIPDLGKRFTFSDKSDLSNFLRRVGLDNAELTNLVPILGGLARRRNRIVHNADFVSSESIGAPPITVLDHFLLLQWKLGVLCFRDRLLKGTGWTGLIYQRIATNHENAIRLLAQVGNDLSSLLLKVSRGEYNHSDASRADLDNLLGLLAQMNDSLELKADWFVDESGKPLPDAIGLVAPGR